MIRLPYRSWWISFIFVVIISCQQNTPMDLSSEILIPKPISVLPTNSSFELNEETNLVYQAGHDELRRVAEYLAEILRPSTGYPLQLISSTEKSENNSIQLQITNIESANIEAYELEISDKAVTLSGNEPAGVFRGIQTLRQLFPAKIETKSTQPGPWRIATGKIVDSPEYAYRGAMLDVSRHFFQVDDVRRYLDLLAAIKINTLHLHLSDDQGWRVEIKSRPKLTEIGSQTQVGGGQGGFYTQQQYKDLVSYAADRYITIIPEIDMPGHTNAALASYPELNCDGKAKELYSGIEVGFSTFCTSSEATYEFIDDVIRELAEMTPGKFIHIGGDESHVTPLEDYIPFIERVQNIVKKYGKEVIGWDEIAHAKLVDDAVVQYWDKAENALMGKEQGAKVLMSPAKKTYLDMQYDSTTQLGLHWAAYIEVDDAYDWDPSSLVDGINKEDILGVESPLWSETISTMEDIEFMAFPRILCHAEVGWTPKDQRNWNDFRERLGGFCSRMEALNINYYQSQKIPWK